MKKSIFAIILLLATVAGLRADEQVREVQAQLKSLGFYYGEVDGESGNETSAAISRYQIRNGLKVTGNLDKATLASLRVSGGAPAVAGSTQPQPVPHSQPTPARTTSSIAESDKDFLQKQNASKSPQPSPPVQPVSEAPTIPEAPTQPDYREYRDPNIVATPVTIPQQPSLLSSQYVVMFRRTPYENAPMEVQQNMVKHAQLSLIREQFYNGPVDGIPGPSTEQAIVLFQEASRLPQTGRLDMDTLSGLRLLPNANRTVVEPFYPAPPYNGPQRVYRGIWVQ